MPELGPIIVTGADRSGTTLLYSLLASHPRISMVRRTNLWRWFYGMYGDLADPANLERCLTGMMRYSRLGVLEPDPVRIREVFGSRDPTYGELFAVMHEQHAAELGLPRWGDKSLHTEHYAHEIFDELPHARVLHMVRDPRDRYASILRRYEKTGREPKGLASAMGRWIASVRAGEHNATTYTDRYRIVRYETLATEPEATMREVCEFIGERFEPEMLAMGAVPDVDVSGNSSFETLGPGEISTRSIGRFSSALPERTIALIQTLARRWMTRHGYREVALTLRSRERLRHWAVDVPTEGTRTLVWMMSNRSGGEAQRAVPQHRMSAAGTGAEVP